MAESIAPGFLIATPQLLDDNFDRTVVFMIEHTPEGALGVVINRPSNVKVSDLMTRLGIAYQGDPDAPVLVGGPLQRDNIIVLHAEGNDPDDSRQLGPSLFVGSSSAALGRLFGNPGTRALCFAGYAGWGPGQVESELDRGSWIPAPPDDGLIFAENREELWERALRGQGIDPRFFVPGGPDTGSN